MSSKHQNILSFPVILSRSGEGGRLRALLSAWRHWTRDCYELRLLLALDDHRQLRDMAVSRYDLAHELRRPFWDWARKD